MDISPFIKKLTEARKAAYRAKHNGDEPVLLIVDDVGNEYFVKEIRVNLEDPEIDVIEIEVQ